MDNYKLVSELLGSAKGTLGRSVKNILRHGPIGSSIRNQKAKELLKFKKQVPPGPGRVFARSVLLT